VNSDNSDRIPNIMKKILYPELSSKLTGLCFKIHKELGRFCREKQYSDRLEQLLKESSILYQREYDLGNLDSKNLKGNKVDFLIENKIILEVKVKKFITKEDYNQMQRYLQNSGLELGIIVNFRNTYLKPKRILNTKLHSDNSDVNSDNSDRVSNSDRFKILEHKADLKIRVFGKTKEKLFENAMVGMFEAAKYEMTKGQTTGRLTTKRLTIKIKSIDFSSLLVDFLSEVLYLVETKKLVFEKVEFKKFKENEIEATLIGKPLKRMGVHIKGVTYHDLKIFQKNGNFEAEILFDI
jgi:GxxExxY protein